MKKHKKHNHRKMRTQTRIIVVLMGVIWLGGYVTYVQARNLSAKENIISEETAKRFTQEMLTHEYAEKLAVEKAHDEAIQTAKYGSTEDKIKVLALTDQEAELIRRESSFNHVAKNPESTAFGLYQFLRSTRTKYAKMFGYQPDTDNPFEQVTMMRKYVSDRYVTIENALKFHDAKGWY